MKRDLERDPLTPAESIRSAFAATFAASPVAAVLTDAGGRLLWVNEACCGLFGSTEQELLAVAFGTLVDTGDTGDAGDEGDEGEQTGGTAEPEPFRRRQRLRGPGGRSFEAEVVGWPVTTGEQLLRLDPADVLAHGPLEARLIEPCSTGDEVVGSEAATHTILADMPEGVAITDPSGAITTINPALEAMTGLSADDARGRPLSEAVPILDATCRVVRGAEHLLAQAFERGGTVNNLGRALTVRSADGSRIPIAVTAAPVYDESGTLLGGIQIVRDVSAERDAEDLKSTLISTASHELRTPLAVIVGYSEILLTRKVDEAKAREAVERINSSAKRLSRLIEDLILASRIDAGRLVIRPRAVEVRPAVEHAAAAVGGERSFVFEVADDLPAVWVDPDLVHQILTNVLSNAVKYSEDAVTISAREEAGAVAVSVTDRGLGMSEADLQQLFGRFFRSDRREVRRVEGTGLGLFITRSLVGLLGGRIDVESRVDQGTTVRFTLPAAPTT